MPDITPGIIDLIILMVSVWIGMGLFFIGWYTSPTNKAKVQRMLTHKNMGKIQIIGKGANLKTLVLNLEDPLIKTANKIYKALNKDKDGNLLFFLDSGIPTYLFNEEKAIPMIPLSKTIKMLFCKECERDGDEIGEPYVKDGKNLCPYCESHPMLIEKEVEIPINPHDTGNSKDEGDILGSIFTLMEEDARLSTQNELIRKLKEIDLLKWGVIITVILLLAIVAISIQNGNILNQLVASASPTANQVVQNATKP